MINGEQNWGKVAPDIAPTSGGMDYASSPSLNAMNPIGNGVTTAQYHNGVSGIVGTMSADMTNGSTDLNVTYDQTNRSAKFKNPRNTQDTGIMYSDQK